MSYLLEVIKIIGGPGSLGFLATTVVASMAAMHLWPRTRRAGAKVLAGLLVIYLGLATPVVASGIIGALPSVPEPSSSVVARIRALVVFDGDNLTGRQRRAHRLLRHTSPQVVWLLGADYLLADLQVAMQPATPLHHDPTTWNTSDQVERVLEIGRGAPWAATAVIASRVQMPRIATLFARADEPVLLLASELDREPAISGLSRWRPSYGTLLASRDAIYEHAALAYYRWQGDLR